MKVLLVDDEQRMVDLLQLYISPYNYHCIKKNSGGDALAYLNQEKVDLVILDVMMPGMDGWETCEKIREFSNVPIIMLTARNENQEMIKGLKKGADDYITKPFNEEVLLARMEAVLRRINPKKDKDLLSFNGLLIDQNALEVFYQDKPIFLTPKEYAILKNFLKSPNRVYSRDFLISSLWSFQTETENRTIDSHIRNIREKLRDVGFPIDQHLKTVWGVGYKWSFGDS